MTEEDIEKYLLAHLKQIDEQYGDNATIYKLGFIDGMMTIRMIAQSAQDEAQEASHEAQVAQANKAFRNNSREVN
jgi:hypothetical protein